MIHLYRETANSAILVNKSGIVFQVDADEYESLKAVALVLADTKEGMVDGDRSACLTDGDKK